MGRSHNHLYPMLFRIYRLVVLLGWLTLSFLNPARALVLEPLSIESLAARAELVLQGKILSRTCLRDPSGRIYTKVELQVTDLWKGAIAGDPFTIVHGGGTLGEEESAVAGQVEYRIGEEVVAFLVRNARGEGVTLGLMQGKFEVWQDAVGHTKYVSNPFHGLRQPGAAMAVQTAGGSPLGPKPLLLSELRKQVLGGNR